MGETVTYERSERPAIDTENDRLFVGDTQELALGVVCPGVVGADESSLASRLVLHQPRVAMAARIDEGMSDAVCVARDEEWDSGDFASNVVVGAGQLVRMGDDLRKPAEELLPLSFEAFRRQVSLDGRDRLLGVEEGAAFLVERQ